MCLRFDQQRFCFFVIGMIFFRLNFHPTAFHHCALTRTSYTIYSRFWIKIYKILLCVRAMCVCLWKYKKNCSISLDSCVLPWINVQDINDFAVAISISISMSIYNSIPQCAINFHKRRKKKKQSITQTT